MAKNLDVYFFSLLSPVQVRDILDEKHLVRHFTQGIGEAAREGEDGDLFPFRFDELHESTIVAIPAHDDRRVVCILIGEAYHIRCEIDIHSFLRVSRPREVNLFEPEGDTAPAHEIIQFLAFRRILARVGRAIIVVSSDYLVVDGEILHELAVAKI